MIKALTLIDYGYEDSPDVCMWLKLITKITSPIVSITLVDTDAAEAIVAIRRIKGWIDV